VAVYDTVKNTWSPLGAGVNGKVLRVVGMTMNITSSSPEVVVSVNGEFTELNAFGSNPAVSASGFGIWVPSQGNWLRNLDLPVESINGILSTSILGDETLYAGSLSSSTIGANGVATLGNTLGRLPLKILASDGANSSSPLAKRADTLTQSTLDGVVTGTYDVSNGRNLTILGGHFTATSANGSAINNLVILDGAKNDDVSGIGPQIDSNSTFSAVAIQGDVLYAGGNVTGTVNGAPVNALITYDLVRKSFNAQPPRLSGGGAAVSSITVRSGTGEVYVGGSFRLAGALGCPGVCVFNTATGQWSQAGQGFDGTVNSMIWATGTTLLAAGNLTINSTVSTFIAKYDVNTRAWDNYPGASQLPGPVKVITVGTSDGSEVWASGTRPDGSAYLMRSRSSSWIPVNQTLEPGTDIRGLQIFSLTSSHEQTETMNSNEALLLTGSIKLPDFGPASAVLFNGTTFTPYALTTNEGNTAGSIARVFTERNNFFTSNGGKLPLVFVVLIALAVSLALILLIILAGLLLHRYRKKRDGYMPAPTHMHDRGSGIRRIPPQELFESLGKGRPGAPQV